MKETKLVKLIYITDPMCSWCYGFAPEITKVVEQTKAEMDLELVMGGLRPYNTETMQQLGGFLAKHWHHVEDRSGQVFNYNILKDTAFVYDTEPPARATVVVRSLAPALEFDFFKKVQAVFYAENKNTNDLETYLPLVKELGIEEAAFAKAFESEEMKEKIRRDFEKSREWGVSGFPTLLLQREEQLHLLATGYTDASIILKKIDLVNGKQN